MPNIKRGSPTARPAETNVRGVSTGLFRAGIMPLSNHQSATPANNDTGKPTTPSDYHPNMPSPSLVKEAMPNQGIALGAPNKVQEGAIMDWFDRIGE